MDLRAIRGKFSEQGKIDLEKSGFRARLDRSLKLTERFPSSTQSNVWELRENRRRLRHCDGYNSQCHCPWGGKAGKGLKPKSGYRLDCARQPRTFRGTSPQREGWGQPVPQRRCRIRRMPLFSDLRGRRLFHFQSLHSAALVSQSNPLRAGNCFPAGEMKD